MAVLTAAEYQAHINGKGANKGKTSTKAASVSTSSRKPSKEPTPPMGYYTEENSSLGPYTRIVGGTWQQHQDLHQYIQENFKP